MVDQEEELYCVCRRPYHSDEFMIECDVCRNWFHGSCVGVEEYQSNDIDSYHCPSCQITHGPLTLKRRRNWHRHDYSELNDGCKAVQSGTVVFINKLKQMKFPSPDDHDVLLRPHGSALTIDWFCTHGFNKPMIVETPDGLDLKVPSSMFTIADVEKHVGSLRELDVIDVSRQDDIKMKMREWVEYCLSRPRQRVLNVISLEVSDTLLNKLVEAPAVVREMDWINQHWPDNDVDSTHQRPQVQKYCLMGTKDSYTDFHVDFGGTSVWYHIIWGKKIFYLIPPTEENLLLYEEWVLSANQSEIFFGSRVNHCYCVQVYPGNTLFIPTGWIHAVLTPEDSLVFGGNFLHSFNIALQLRIYEMELRLQTPVKFLHPCYECLTWYAARNYHKVLLGHLEKKTKSPYYLLQGLCSLTDTLQEWSGSREALKVHKWEIPDQICPSVLISQLKNTLKLLLRESERQTNQCKPNDEEMTIEDQSTHKSIRLRFNHGQLTRHEKDGEKELITMKLKVPQTKRRKQSEDDLLMSSAPDEEAEDDKQHQDDQFGLVDKDDAGATIDDKEDSLWHPQGLVLMEKEAKKQSKQKMKTFENETKSGKEALDTLTTSSKSKSKPRTAKQRLGKILGLDRTGRFLKK